MGDKTERRRTRTASKKPPRRDLSEPGEPAPLRSLLRALAGRSPGEFFARMAVLQVIAEGHPPISSSHELAERLSWLDGKARSAALRALHHGGWLENLPAEGIGLTETGQRAYAVLELLRHGDRMMAALRRKSLGELASAGRDALLPALLPLPLVSTDALTRAAERRILRSRTGKL